MPSSIIPTTQGESNPWAMQIAVSTAQTPMTAADGLSPVDLPSPLKNRNHPSFMNVRSVSMPTRVDIIASSGELEFTDFTINDLLKKPVS